MLPVNAYPSGARQKAPHFQQKVIIINGYTVLEQNVRWRELCTQQCQGSVANDLSAKFALLTEFFLHGIKGFVIPTKSLVEIGMTKIFCYKNICLVLSTKRLDAAAKFLVAGAKHLFVVPNFVAVTNPFFSVESEYALKGNS